MQLISIGLLGEYIGRLYISASGLPRSVVREEVNCEQSKEDSKVNTEDSEDENE